MTYCDDNYAKFIYPQLVSISEVQAEFEINFFLLQSRVSDETVNALVKFSNTLPNINFVNIKVTDELEKYNEIASHGANSPYGRKLFPYEMYFTLAAHKYLPKDIERVFYIQTGDILLVSDVSDYYYSDFKGKSLTVEMANSRMYKADGSMHDEKSFEYFINRYQNMAGVFNSGNYMINVERMRERNISLDDYIKLANRIGSLLREPKPQMWYFSDQTFYSVAFLGEINSLHDGLEQDFNSRPYNFSVYVKSARNKVGKNSMQIQDIKILHYDGPYKPWNIDEDLFEGNVPKEINEENYLNGLTSFTPAAFGNEFKTYWKYVKQTPIYEELKHDAKIYSSALKYPYLVAEAAAINLKKKVQAVEQENAKLASIIHSISETIDQVK